MKTFFLSLLGAFVAILLFFFLIFGFFALLIGAASSGEAPPKNVVLTLDLNSEYPDQAPSTGFAALSGQPGFTDILVRLKAAETDKAVKGIYIRGATLGIGSSRAEELRKALHQFRNSGKFVISHTQGTYGMSGPSAYRSISASDEIWIQPGTDLFMTGVVFETQFLKGLFEKIDVTSEIYPFYEYKNAPNSYNEDSYTEPHREALTALADSIWTASLEEIAEDRDINVQTLRTIVESGPQTADDLINKGLMDKMGYPEEAEEAAKERAGKGAVLVDIAGYAAPPAHRKAPLIAIVGGEGAVVTGGGEGGSPFSAPAGFASDTIAAAILEAGRNERVDAIVFRVDSPGGSPTASDQIWRAIERVQAENDKKVVVSMGSLAASGGYYVSAGADHIMANRSTITGSIGIFGGKFAVDGAFNKIGITFDTVQVGGDFADAYGSDEFTPEQEAVVRAWLKRGYDRFLTLVGEGRGMTYDQVHAIARGRVWSGEDGLEKGIVDEIGTFTDAIAKAVELAGIDDTQRPRLTYYPRRKSGFEALEGLFGVSEEAARAAAVIGVLAGDDRLNDVLEELAVMDAANQGQAQAVGPHIRER